MKVYRRNHLCTVRQYSSSINYMTQQVQSAQGFIHLCGFSLTIFQMWSLCAIANLLRSVITEIKTFPESFGHAFLLILATIAVVTIASFFISEISIRICPPLKLRRHMESSISIPHEVWFEAKTHFFLATK